MILINPCPIFFHYSCSALFTLVHCSIRIDDNFSMLRCLQVDSAVVEELFGARMHMELVPRSEDMIKFLAARGAITQHHLHAIWVRPSLPAPPPSLPYVPHTPCPNKAL